MPSSKVPAGTFQLLLAETQRVVQAYELRAPGQKGIHFKNVIADGSKIRRVWIGAEKF